MKFHVGNEIVSADYLFGVGVIVLAVIGLGAFLRYTRMGIALRASAENADRAALLGIPVKTVQTISWVAAGAIGGVGVFLRSSMIGIPGDGSLGPMVLLFALAAAVVARMESIVVCMVAGVGIGVVADAAVQRNGSDAMTAPIILALILGALLLQRGRTSRALDTGVSTWPTLKEFRPVPPELRNVAEVRWFRGACAVVVGAFLLAFPWIVGRANYGFAQ